MSSFECEKMKKRKLLYDSFNIKSYVAETNLVVRWSAYGCNMGRFASIHWLSERLARRASYRPPPVWVTHLIWNNFAPMVTHTYLLSMESPRIQEFNSVNYFDAPSPKFCGLLYLDIAPRWPRHQMYPCLWKKSTVIE